MSEIRLKVSRALNTGMLDPNISLMNDVIVPITPATTPNTKAIKYFTIGNISAKICAVYITVNNGINKIVKRFNVTEPDIIESYIRYGVFLHMNGTAPDEVEECFEQNHIQVTPLPSLPPLPPIPDMTRDCLIKEIITRFNTTNFFYLIIYTLCLFKHFNNIRHKIITIYYTIFQIYYLFLF